MIPEIFLLFKIHPLSYKLRIIASYFRSSPSCLKQIDFPRSKGKTICVVFMQVSQYLHENRWRQRPCSPAMNMALSASGRVPREGRARLWRTTLLAKSSELYLPAHGWRERWMRLIGSQLSRQTGRGIPRAATSGMLCPMKSGGRSDRSQIVPRTVRREVYKERRQGSALYISCRFSRPSRGNRKTWLNFKRHAMALEIWPVPPQRPHRPGYRIRFPAVVSKLPLVGVSFSAVDTKTELLGYHAFGLQRP